MKIGIFTDVYYRKSLDVKNDITMQKLKKAMTAFQKEKCELCFCLGNLVDQKHQDRAQTLAAFGEIMEEIRAYEIPFYLVPGPHDYQTVTAQDLLAAESIYIPPYTIHTEELVFILLDGNYTPEGHPFGKADLDRRDGYLPEAQVEFVKSRKRIHPNVALILHQSLAPDADAKLAIANAEPIQALIQDSSRIKMVLQGNALQRTETTDGGTRYINIPSLLSSENAFYEIVEV